MTQILTIYVCWTGTAGGPSALWYLGGCSGGVVHALALHHDFVYAGGSFVLAGGKPASRVARWDGTSSLLALLVQKGKN